MARRNTRLYLHMVGAGFITSLVVTPFALFFFPHTRENFFVLLLLCAAGSLLSSLWGYGLANASFRTLIARIREEGHPPITEVARGTDLHTRDLDVLEGSIEHVLRELRRQAERELRSERQGLITTITSLVNALEARDDYTRDHSARVATFAVLLAEKMGIPGQAIEQIHLAALLHDIGKIGIRDAILLKPGKLTPEERRVIEDHPDHGVAILTPVPGLEEVRHIVRHHHERVDGTGYPGRLAGEGIPIGSRIVAVADTFDSMIRARPYRGNIPLERVVDELRRVSGTQLWPACVEAFLDLLMESDEMEEFRRESEEEGAGRAA